MPCRSADIVLSGTLVCKMTSFSGRLIEVSRLREGNLVAPAFVLGKDRNMPVSVETASRVEVLRLPAEEFLRLLENNPRLSMNFIRTLSNINAFLTKKLRVLSLFTVREKVAWLLLKRAEEQGSDSITLLRSRQQIADGFGIQKFSLVRILSDLEKEGAISVDGRKITIIDRKRLRGF
jgi:CRP-like cAMP-binding protein